MKSPGQCDWCLDYTLVRQFEIDGVKTKQRFCRLSCAIKAHDATHWTLVERLKQNGIA